MSTSNFFSEHAFAEERILTDQPTPYYATPKQPRLIGNNRDKRRATELLPTQMVEVIRLFYAEETQGRVQIHDTDLWQTIHQTLIP